MTDLPDDTESLKALIQQLLITPNRASSKLWLKKHCLIMLLVGQNHFDSSYQSRLLVLQN